MSAALDRRAYAELTTSTVPTGEAFAYWRECVDPLMTMLWRGRWQR